MNQTEKKKGGLLQSFSRFLKPEEKGEDYQGVSKAIGIDLGTTNTVFGIKKVYTEILKNREQEELTPSCVTKRDKRYVVGRDALAWRKQDPNNTILSIKRLMGRNYADEEVQKIIREHKVSYLIKPLSTGTVQSMAVLLNGQEHTPEQISAEILKKVKMDAEEALGERISHAVITIPSYFNDKQKHATRTAATLAGFKVQRLLSEPTAAAISFGVDQTREKDIHNIIVYDFGGGTFDISVLTMAEGQFIEQAKGGDMWLGGDDIDNLIIEYVFDQMKKEYPDLEIRELIQKLPQDKRSRLLGELHEKAEKAKISLSERETALIDILGLLKDERGSLIDIDVEISRAEFESLIIPMVERSITLMENVLLSLHYTPEMIDKVLLVGGSSCIPLVQRKVKEKFGQDKVMIHQKPMLSVSEGAAILAHRLSNNYECPGCGKAVLQTDHTCPSCNFDLDKFMIETGVVDIVHSAAHDYFIYLEDNPRYLLIEKNTPLPIEKTETFRLVDPRQSLVHLRFFNLVNEVEESIGDLWLGIEKTSKDIEKELEEEEKIHREILCTFRIDENNIIEVAAQMKDHPEVHISRTLSRGKADEKLFYSLENLIQRVNSTKYSVYTIEDFIHRSVNVIQDINQIVHPETGEVKQEIFHQAQLELETADKIMEKDTAPYGVVNFVKRMLDTWKPFVSQEGVTKLENLAQTLQKTDRSGSYEDIVKVIDKIQEEIHHQPVATLLMELERAYAYYHENQLVAEADKISTYIEKIIEAVTKGDHKKFAHLAEEIWPELHKILELERWQTRRVEKGIVK